MYYPSKSRNGGKKTSICVPICMLLSFLINAAPRRMEKIAGFSNVLYILLFILSSGNIGQYVVQDRFGQHWLQKRELCKNISHLMLEDALLRQCCCGRKLQMQREHKEVVLGLGDGVLVTAIQYAGRAHQPYILVRGGGGSIRNSLLGFHRA